MQNNALENLLGNLDLAVKDVLIREVLPHEQLDLEPCEAPTMHFVQRGEGRFGSGDGRSIFVTSDCLIISPRGSHQVFKARPRSTSCIKHLPDGPMKIITVRLAAG